MAKAASAAYGARMSDLVHATCDDLIRLFLAEGDARQELERRAERQAQEIAA